ncbi:MAG: hypothetical protein PHC49_16575 [Desulfuromonadaceae bacterium]|nr:hypothetical protein [Desulfuromonadaceae bacterium]
MTGRTICNIIKYEHTLLNIRNKQRAGMTETECRKREIGDY